MPISVSCRQCDWMGKVPDNLAGKKGKCPTCGELIPIKGGPAPRAASKGKADDEPDVVDDEPRPKKSAARRRDDDEDDRPRKRRRDEDDDRPARSRRRDDDDEDERPSKARRRDDEDDQRPSRSRRRRDDDDDDDFPRKKRRPLRRQPKKTGMGKKRIGALLGGLFALLVGGAWLAYYLLADNARFRIYPLVLLIFGIIGMFQGATGMGLGEDSDDDSDDDGGDFGGGDD
jgi:hypothetical protein